VSDLITLLDIYQAIELIFSYTKNVSYQELVKNQDTV
jgi:uncharacterized protein with HEPN domain